MTDIPAALGLTSEDVVGLLTAAGRAPSLHNSQPWLFRVAPDVIEVWADPTRRLPAADPHGREQRLACGAALFNLRLALHGLGIRPLVTLQADRAYPDLIATIRYGGRKPPTPSQRDLLAAIPRRRTNRRPFTDQPVTGTELTALRRAAVEEGAWLHVVDDPDERAQLQDLSAQAYAVQQADPAFQAEFARWTAVSPDRADGIPALPGEQRPALHDRWVKRDFTDGQGRTTAQTGIVFETRPAIVVLSAQMFGPTSEVSTGQAMQRVLLTATLAGLAVSFLSQIIEVDQTRERLRSLIRGVHNPQVLLRIGRGWPVPSTPRRPVADTLITAPPPHSPSHSHADEHRDPGWARRPSRAAG
ncbi:Acg family FMN-binding oxidoreductase [Pseudonocardia sp. CA-107938]|uniref:Acg family FMN-binding oxidoreductase n=1 Tax=Pseudonocardia sp. CA-107938 TaxID=3240021 RepID=UPI003D8DA4F8